MRTICFYFQVHQPFRLRRYRFFDIGHENYYFDDYSNNAIMQKVAEKCYLPTNKVFLNLIKEYGERFKISYSISGTALDQMELYAPDVLKSFQELAKTGCVEFLAETYSHSLSALKSKEEFFEQVRLQVEKIEKLFGQKPAVFRNTELIYSDDIGEMVAEMGFKAMLTEGAKHILGWKSPNYVYYNPISPKLKLLLKNFKLSDDIAFRFSNREWEEWPLTTEKYVTWLNGIDKKEKNINLFMDYETFGEHQWEDSGIFEFLKALPKAVFSNTDFTFATPSEVSDNFQPVAPMHVLYPISWADEERDLTAWLGNELQDEAFAKLYELAPIVKKIDDPDIQRDWRYLQTSDHFYYMCTKFFSDGNVHKYFSPYNTPYDAFINFMNVLSDFILRIKSFESKMKPDVSELKEDEILSKIAEYEVLLNQLKAKVEPESVAKKRAPAKSKKIVKEPVVKVKKEEVKKEDLIKEPVKTVKKGAEKKAVEKSTKPIVKKQTTTKPSIKSSKAGTSVTKENKTKSKTTGTKKPEVNKKKK